MKRAEYVKIYAVSERTANRELGNLVHRKVVEKKGEGPEIHYILARYNEKKKKTMNILAYTLFLIEFRH